MVKFYLGSVILAMVSVMTWQFGSSKSTSPEIIIATSTTPLSSPVILAHQLGYFEQFGVDVKLISKKGGVACFNAVQTGQATLATTSASVLSFAAQNQSPFMIFASFAESDNDVKFVYRKSRHTFDVLSLKQAKIGVIQHSASEFFSKTVLLMHGVMLDDVSFSYGSGQNLIQQLKQNELDAAALWEPDVFKLLSKHHDEFSIINTQGLYNLNFNLVGLKELPAKDLKAILNALAKAIQYLHQKPQQAKAHIADFLDISEAELDWSWGDYDFRLTLGNGLLTNLQMQTSWLKHEGSNEATTPSPQFRQYFSTLAASHITYLNQTGVPR